MQSFASPACHSISSLIHSIPSLIRSLPSLISFLPTHSPFPHSPPSITHSLQSLSQFPFSLSSFLKSLCIHSNLFGAKTALAVLPAGCSQDLGPLSRPLTWPTCSDLPAAPALPCSAHSNASSCYTEARLLAVRDGG
jgi:hypothetical protein